MTEILGSPSPEGPLHLAPSSAYYLTCGTWVSRLYLMEIQSRFLSEKQRV